MNCILNNQYNIGHICTKQQCEAGKGDKTAIRWIFPNHTIDYSYLDLEKNSNKVANVLSDLGIKKGDRAFIFTPRSPEMYFIFLGILKIQAVAGIFFSNFGEDALLDRLQDSQASILFTKKNYLRKIYSIWPRLPSLKKIIVVDADVDESERVISYSHLISHASDTYDTPVTKPDTPSILHYTSGSTGKPKGVQHVHGSILLQNATFKQIFDIRDDDIYWCTADPGWVTGVSYGIIGPFSFGTTQIVYGGAYDAAIWFDILQNEKINIWYTAPTALRMLMQNSQIQYQPYNLSQLRSIFSVGEPLNPAVIDWGRRVIHKDIYDTWFQTETGAIMISNRLNLPIKPGSMGKPFEGIEIMILDDEGLPVPELMHGHLCIKKGWPSMFITYLNHHNAYNARFKHDYYDSGDMAYKDHEGYFWFVGRSDDVINTAGHLVGPFEIESALLEIGEIAESGVIGIPDGLLYEKVVAYLALKPDCKWSRELELKIRIHISNRISSIATPQEFIIVNSIPKNKSGKIMRRVLKGWYTDQDLGDISTLEEN
jgi:acetyl-CoA synthetase